MATYKGYDYTIEYDEDYPLHLNWRFCIYQQTKIEYVCLRVDYAGTRNEAEQTAKEYIDSWIEQDGHTQAEE
jgi:hypothetical protein